MTDTRTIQDERLTQAFVAMREALREIEKAMNRIGMDGDAMTEPLYKARAALALADKVKP